MKYLLLSLSLWGVSTATANAECNGKVYGNQQILQDFTMLDKVLVKNDVDAIKSVGSKIEANVQCLETLQDVQIFGKLYRAIGAYYFSSNNMDEARKWFLTAQETNPSFSYGVTNIDPAMVQFFNSLREEAVVEPVVLEDKRLNLPEGTKFYIDGRSIDRPELTKGRPHIGFLVSTATQQIQARYRFEDEFPPSLLIEGAEEEVVDVGIIDVERIRPPSKTPLMIVGGLSTLTALGIYGFTFKTNQDFEAATTEDEMRSIQGFNNGLVITAGVVGVLGFGLGYTGVLIDEKGGIRF
ncbi:MAG: hypothetical protein VX278_23010 [Myxococcota bacterium]|nr:hypothetical protein [Myxococcota bacterium]